MVSVTVTASAGAHAAPASAGDGWESVAPGVRYRAITTSGPVRSHVLHVDLRVPTVSVDLLYAGAVAARDEVSDMADAGKAVAAVNGDFFNIHQTNAPVGPAIADRRHLKAAVPGAQRYGPAGPPGTSNEDVFGVSTDRAGVVSRLVLDGKVHTPDGGFPLDGLNQYALPVDGVGAFTSDWGTADRTRSTCGTELDRNAPCSEETAEVMVTDGRVTTVTSEPGSGAIPADTVVLVGREDGADELDDLEPGDRVDVDHELVSGDGTDFQFAVGGFPILRDGAPIAGTDDTVLAPRTAAGFSADGRQLYLVAVDGRSAESVGMTLAELAAFLRDLGAVHGVNLDGGGSTALVARTATSDGVLVRNVPSDGSERPVPNAVGIFSAAGS